MSAETKTTPIAAQSSSKTVKSLSQSGVDKELALFSQFRDSETIRQGDIDVLYGIVAGAAIASRSVAGQVSGAIRGSCCPGRFSALYGAILSSQEDRINRVLVDRFGAEHTPSGEPPLSGVFATLSAYEDYCTMIEARSAIAIAAKSGSPTALLTTLKAQVAYLEKNIRNFKDGDTPKEEEVQW